MKAFMRKTTKPISKYIVPVTFAAILSTSAFAGEKGPVEDAWLEGKLDTVIVLNQHLNPFKLSTQVENGVATITGNVDSSVEKSLVSELAKGIDGIKDINNEVVVGKDKAKKDDGAVAVVTDSYITTAISTKLLLNTDIDSTDIEIETKGKTVTISGTVETGAEKDLVEQIASNTFEVKDVKNMLRVVKKS